MKLLAITLVVLTCVACGAGAPTRQAQDAAQQASPAAPEFENPLPSLQVESDNGAQEARPEGEETESQFGPEDEEEVTAVVDEEGRDSGDAAEAPRPADAAFVQESVPEDSEPKADVGHHRVRRFGGLPRNGSSKKFSPSGRMKHKLGGGGKSRT